MTTNDQAAMNEQLTQLRLQGLSIDGDNRYKQDLIDAVIGAMMFGAQGANPPPAGHWLEQFYVIGRKEREARAALATQPAAGEPKPIGYTHDKWKDNLEGVYHFTTLVRDKQKGWETPVFLAPPTAAHGDEAVRKDAEAAYVEMTCQPVLIDGATHYYLSSERMQAFDRFFSVDVSDAAMRAQGEGEVQ